MLFGTDRSFVSSGLIRFNVTLAPPTPFKNLAKDTPPGCHPPILAYGTHSSFLHIILRVRLDGFFYKRCYQHLCQRAVHTPTG